MEQHLLIEYELDPDDVDELASGRSGGWLGGHRRQAGRGIGWRTFVRPVWPIVLLVGVLAAGVRAVTFIPAALWTPMLFDVLRLVAVATPLAIGLVLLARRRRRAR